MNENTDKTVNESNQSNQPLLDMSILDAMNALYEHDQIKANSNTTPVNVTPDRFDEVRIRLGQIDNYLIERNGSKIDPLKVDNVINMNTGKVVIKWVEYNGGIVRPEQFGYPSEGYVEDWKYSPEKDSKYPEERTLNCYNHDKASEKEMLELSHAFIWNNGSNWCGMNYLPPVGSIVIVGFKKNNMPVILGYMPTDYKSCNPYIKPGETILKGYGSNYIHWRWSNKLDINVKSKKGEVDLDDPYKKQTYPNTINMWMRFDCYTRNLIIDINQTDGNKSRTIFEIKPELLKVTSGSNTLSVGTSDIYAQAGSSKLYLKNGNINMSSGKINLVDNTYVGNSQAINQSRLDEQLNPLIKRIEFLENQVKSLNQQLNNLNGNLSTVNDKTTVLSNDIASLSRRVSTLENK